ncbi:HAD-SF-IA-v3: HAD hydrolase, family IA, variant 3 [Rubrobacter radiotolerans]|uniref:HAD family phosphatase n=1 Tax=Rubrobacter radiotolerans TaxID=42256 RepID=A0A023X525_RUBRA|nr:HAD family phosphatase [Rubrobacter radiotolerans]AHY47169.1 HAD-SF-IA-v3: HAD hydrolase, family IA, variant 3 [Rubrobacter radiotolerans]MDX5894574.1 HAD family phosphatase [Rubrobacter radiotolerans]SMC06292.1 haloacid dehalogenase superfamily, subfamily IA, variant 3 with third motif having DD or ED [Rubrobacter radiotolerans DSM 5868]
MTPIQGGSDRSPRRIKALLFDLDGTIAETDSVHFPAWAEILREHGHEVDWAFYRENISGRLNPEIVAEYIPGMSEEETVALVERKESHFRARVGGLEPTSGLVDLIRFASSRDIRSALVTNAPRANAVAVIEALGLGELFSPIVSADDVSAGKPSPEPYLEALARLGVLPEEALVFEDSRSGIASALAAGVPTVGVASTQEPEFLLAAGAFTTVADFTDPHLADLLRPEP